MAVYALCAIWAHRAYQPSSNLLGTGGFHCNILGQCIQVDSCNEHSHFIRTSISEAPPRTCMTIVRCHQWIIYGLYGAVPMVTCTFNRLPRLSVMSIKRKLIEMLFISNFDPVHITQFVPVSSAPCVVYQLGLVLSFFLMYLFLFLLLFSVLAAGLWLSDHQYRSYFCDILILAFLLHPYPCYPLTHSCTLKPYNHINNKKTKQ